MNWADQDPAYPVPESAPPRLRALPAAHRARRHDPLGCLLLAIMYALVAAAGLGTGLLIAAVFLH